MYRDQQVSLADLQQFANRHSIDVYNETSAQQNTGINEIFQKIVQQIDSKREEIKNNQGFRGETVRLERNKNVGRKKKGCKC
mmetsp:Transcript_14406/g.24552  ORF Transcript_14406/g.24552 Transcript_14406/m.24552 type:complete len:82 (+) Transcript_14406:379-624(+)